MSRKIIFLLSLLSIISLIKSDKLIFVETHFRNGAKAPWLKNTAEPVDILKETWDNPGELTGVGERMQYILGFRNRLRYVTDTYKQFLSEKYDAHEILMLSTASNYTLVSASAQLQGLYPMDIGIGDYLTEEQQEYAVPGVDISMIQEEVEKLGNCSLPNSMTVIPVHMIHQLEKRMLLFENSACTEKTKENKNKNIENKNIKENVNNFNNDFAKGLNTFYGYAEDKKYDFIWISDFCDNFKADIMDDRELTQFKETKIDFEKLEASCDKILESYWRYYLFGDSDRNIATMESSKAMDEMADYMKYRVDADIKGEKIEEKYSDFSRPKMVMISSEGSTLSAHQLFLMKIFNLGENLYRHPQYADQISYEITREENVQKLDEEKYTVTMFFNDEKIFSKNFKDFYDKIKGSIWDIEKINDFCDYQTDEEKKANFYLYIIYAWSGLVLILIIIAIVLCVKVYKKKNSLKDELEGLTDN